MINLRSVKNFIQRAETQLSRWFKTTLKIRSLEFDAYACPKEFEVDNVKLHIY